MSQIDFVQEITLEKMFSPEEIVKILLQQRKIEDSGEFLNPKSPLEYQLSDFGYEDEFKKILPVLQTAHKEKKMVVVYMDYDADGITGGSVLWETLHLMGFKVMPYIPHRVHEGYGFSIKGIDKVIEDFNPFLIISVDHGISAVEQVKYAKERGVNVIVTDHHSKQATLPEAADGIFHIPALSGSGVAYFFAKEIFNRLNIEMNQKLTKKLQHNFEYDYMTVASIGTIADLVPLVGVSRSMAKYGLLASSKIKNVGLKAMIKEAKIDSPNLSPYHVGFVIAPRINAVGRLEHALDALRLICTNNAIKAEDLANKVGQQNTQRQDMVLKAVKEAKDKVEDLVKLNKMPKLITVISEDWHEGVIGLIASRLMEEYYRPVIAMTKHDGLVKGSARSLPSFNITEFLTKLKGHLLNFGGHKQAAGFALDEKNLESFLEDVNNLSEELITDEQLIRTYKADLKIPVSMISEKLVKTIQSLEPFGIGNPQPVFYSTVQIVDAKLFGKQKDHLKIFGKEPDERKMPLEFIYFKGADFYSKLAKGQEISILYKVDINRWNGRETVRGIIQKIDGV